MLYVEMKGQGGCIFDFNSQILNHKPQTRKPKPETIMLSYNLKPLPTTRNPNSNAASNPYCSC